MTINITKKDIYVGKQRSSFSCPIALAAQRISGDQDCTVGETSMCINNVLYQLPKQARSFIRRFDNEKSVKPFTFEVI